MPGSYLNKKAAAKLCGYSPAYFMELVNKYQIKRYGPGLNKFREADLHQWMENPACFLSPPKLKIVPSQLNPTAKKGFTPVQI